jgi:uncharacterized protein
MSNPEDEYFARIDRENKEKLRQTLDKDSLKAELENQKKLHWNKCGKCGSDMHSKPFRGVEIELCEHCGAVLLDSGELEKLAGADQSGIFQSMRGLFGG